MEASTGAVLYEKDADTRRAPASVTKINDYALIFDALEDGKLRWKNEVSTSEYAASMGGSQVFLEPGEIAECGYDVKMYFRKPVPMMPVPPWQST